MDSKYRSADERPRSPMNEKLEECCVACKQPISSNSHVDAGADFNTNDVNQGIQLPQIPPILTNFEVRLLFNRLDRNYALKINRDEFKYGFYDILKLNVDSNILDKVFENNDINGDMLLQVTEFTAAYTEVYDMISRGENIFVSSSDLSNQSFVVKATRYGSYTTKNRITGIDESNSSCDCYVIYLTREPCSICKQRPSNLPIIGYKYSIVNTPPDCSTDDFVRERRRTIQGGDRRRDWTKALKESVPKSWQPSNGKSWHRALMDMVEEDSKKYKDINWWIDVSCRDINTMKHNLVDWFQLPRDEPKITSTLSNFNVPLSDNIEDRVLARNNLDNLDPSNSSLTMFIQLMYAYKIPVLKIPRYTFKGSNFINTISSYFIRRFPNLVELFPQGNNNERNIRLNLYAYSSALMYEKIFESDKYVRELYLKAKKNSSISEDVGGNSKKTAALCWNEDVPQRIWTYDDVNKSNNSDSESWKDFRSCEPAPFHDYVIDSKANKNIITSSADYMTKNKPSFRYETLGLHLMDFGYGCNCLLTIRQIDDENVHLRNDDYNDAAVNITDIDDDMIEPLSRKGVCGRLFYALWLKIIHLSIDEFEFMDEKGPLGEISDGPMALASTIMCITQDFSRQHTIGPLIFWIDALEKEINDIIVTKHFAHAAAIDKALKDVNLYAAPWCDFWDKMLLEAKEEEAIIAEEKEAVKFDHAEPEIVDDSHPPSAPAGILRRQAFSVGPRRSSLRSNSSSSSSNTHTTPRRRSIAELVDKRRRNSVNSIKSSKVNSDRDDSDSDCSSVETLRDLLPDNVSKIELKLKLIIRFFGKDFHRNESKSYFKEIEKIKYGHSKHDLRGNLAWDTNIKSLLNRMKRLREKMKSLRFEKRQFTSFILTIMTVLLAPMTIITGYWGMNFENMRELTPDTYPSVPGVKIMWLAAAIIYGLLFTCAIHFRVIYSAS